MKHLPTTLVLICTALTATLPLIADNLWDVVEEAQNSILQRYPSETSIARKKALEELETIADSDRTEEQKIELIRSKYLSTSVPRGPFQPKETTTNPAQLVFRPPLQWTIHSIEIAYDIDSSTNILLSMESLYQEEERNNQDNSTGGSTTQTSSKGSRTQDETSVGGNVQTPSSFSLNPLKWLQAKADYQWIKTDKSSKDTTSTSSSQWNERAQRAWNKLYEQKAQILQNTKISNCHLTFSISFKNTTNSDLVFNPRNVSIPIYAGNELLTDAMPDTRLPQIQIPGNAYTDLMFRADLNTTSALKLIGYMRSHAPLIPLERGQFIIVSEDGKIRNAIQESLQVETVPFRCRDFELCIRKVYQGKTTTVADAMRAINAVFEKAPFKFDNNENCISLIDIPLEKQGDEKVNLKRLPVIGFNGSIVSAQIPSSTLGRPLLEDGLSLDVVDIVSDDEYDAVWNNSPAQLQEHYVSYLKPVAEKGDAQAQNILACCYYFGRGVNNNYSEAVKWFRKSADQGVLDSIDMLGVCYEMGRGVDLDYSEAFKWYSKSAEKGHPSSQMSLGRFYQEGKGVKKDETEAVKWFRKSADQGFMYAQNALGVCFSDGSGVKQDYEEAVKWFQKAADQGYLYAQLNLGDSYFDGEGVKQDYEEAIKWFQKAADQGNAYAQNKLGVCYSDGKGVKQDYEEAVKWFRKAADQGNDWGQFNLGIAYQYGYGVPKDTVEARKWYRKAADQGNESAIKALNGNASNSTNSFGIQNRGTDSDFAQPNDMGNLQYSQIETWKKILKDCELEQRTFTKGQDKLKYCQHLYNKEEWGKPAILVFLHGIGERGDNNLAQNELGVSDIVKNIRAQKRKVILLTCQCPSSELWAPLHRGGSAAALQPLPSKSTGMIPDLIDAKIKEFNADPDRVYIVGHSMGGYGVWDIISRRPDLFAAAIPICGAGDPAQASVLKDMAISMFHGDRDNLVPTNLSREMYRALANAGNRNVKLTIYEGVEHNSWEKAYADPDTFRWLFAQKRSEAGKRAKGKTFTADEIRAAQRNNY
jgi:TPR repeat protein/predicted esterase